MKVVVFFPYMFLLRYKALCAASFCAAVTPPSSHALYIVPTLSPCPHLCYLRFKIPLFLCPSLSLAILVLLFLAASQTSGGPRGLFPKRSLGWTPGTDTNMLPSHARSIHFLLCSAVSHICSVCTSLLTYTK